MAILTNRFVTVLVGLVLLSCAVFGALVTYDDFNDGNIADWSAAIGGAIQPGVNDTGGWWAQGSATNKVFWNGVNTSSNISFAIMGIDAAATVDNDNRGFQTKYDSGTGFYCVSYQRKVDGQIWALGKQGRLIDATGTGSWNITETWLNNTNQGWVRVRVNNSVLFDIECKYSLSAQSKKVKVDMNTLINNMTFDNICVSDGGTACDHKTFFGYSSPPPPISSNNSVSFAASNPSDGLSTLIATRNYTFVPVMNNTVNISSCSLYSNTSNATNPMATISNPANNTEAGFLITLPSAQTHNYQVICSNNDTSEADTGNRTYSYSDFAFSSESHNVSEYETVSTAFSYVFDVGEGVSNTTVSYLDVNGTLYSLTSTGGTNVTLACSRTPTIEVSNNTQYQHNYTFLYVFANGSSFNKTSPANYYQNVWWGFWLNLSVSPLNVLEGDTITANATVTNISSLVTVVVQQFYNGSSDIPSYSAAGYVSTFIAPSIEASYYPSDLESNLTLTYGATTLNRTSPQSENVTVWKVTLVDCGGAFTTVTLNFTFWDEEDIDQRLYSNMESSFWGFPNATLNHTYSMNCTNQTYCEVCITPSWANFTVDSWQSYVSPAMYYSAGSYPQRAYFLEDAALSNVTSNVSLFLENTTLAKLVAVSVDDEGGQAVKQTLLYFARYYLAENVYRTIAMVRTDDFGSGNTYLRPNDIWYRITAVQDGEVIGVFTPQTISCDPSVSYCPLSLSLSPSIYLEYLEYINKIAFACAYSDATNYTTCSYTDTSGLMQYARLRVWQQGTFYNTLVCDVNATTASGTLACFLGAAPSGIYTYSFVAHFQDETTLDGGTIEITPGSALFGKDGLIYTVLIVMLTFFLGIFNPAVAIGLAGVGVFVSWGIGLFSVPWSALVAFAVVVVALIAAMIRRGG